MADEDLEPDEKGLFAIGLDKSFRRHQVMKNVSIGLRRNEVVGLLGPNGAGKTTCFHTIAGLLRPDTGRIFLDGSDVTPLPIHRRARLGLGYLPQESSVFRGMTVEGNILAILELREPDQYVRLDRLEELLSKFAIDRVRRSPAYLLSGGQMRRVEIARCLAANPRYVLLDEPFAGIDPKAVADIRAMVTGLRDHGIGVLVTDQNERATLNLVDRAYVMHEGTILAKGSPAEIEANPAVRRYYLGDSYQR